MDKFHHILNRFIYFALGKLLPSILLLLFLIPVSAQLKKTIKLQAEERGEVYLLVDVPNKTSLYNLGRIASIDRTAWGENKDKVYAYVSKNNLQEFENLALDYQLQTPPSLKLATTMCADINAVKNWNCYPTYDQYIALMNEFATDYPDLCRLEEIGKSVDGRSVLSIKISDNVTQSEEEPAFLYTSTMHGDEVTGYVLMLRFVDYLLSNYQSDTRIKELIDGTEIWINPLSNPDGTYAAGNTDMSGAVRFNANGIDLNRNFPDPEDGDHPDGKAWAEETADMMDFMKAHNFLLTANFHGGAEVVNYPWDRWYTRHADDNWYQNLSRQYADTVHANITEYMTYLDNGITNGADWYQVSGGRQDYTNYYLHKREVTIEISDVKMPDAASLPNFWNYNYRSLLNYIDRVHQGFYGKVTDVDGNPLRAKMFIENHDVDSSDIYSDPENGMYYRLIMGGTYNLSFSAKGYNTKIFNNMSILDNERQRLDVILEKTAVSVNKITNDAIRIKTINNPFTDYISGSFYVSDYQNNLKFTLYDSNGRLVNKTLYGDGQIGINSFYIATSKLKSGLYMLVLSTASFSIKKKLIKR